MYKRGRYVPPFPSLLCGSAGALRYDVSSEVVGEREDGEPKGYHELVVLQHLLYVHIVQ